ncbi:unnamed protein product, partial [Meganyctiphanes norvegica]
FQMSKLKFTNIVLLADERDEHLRDLSFPNSNLKLIIRNDMSSLTAFNYIKEHYKSKEYKEKTLYVMICGIKCLYTVIANDTCKQYNCEYPISYWESPSSNVKVASNMLIDNSKILMDKVQMVSNKKDALVFSGIVPICLQNIFMSNVTEHRRRSPYHQVTHEESFLPEIHQLDIQGWKAIILYNEFANEITSKHELQWNIEEECFSSSKDKPKHFLKSKILHRDGYHLLETAEKSRKEKIVKALKKSFILMGIENPFNMPKIKDNESSKNIQDSSKFIKKVGDNSNEINKDKLKSKLKVSENQDYFLDTDGDGGKQNRDNLKETTVNYLNIVLVCDERDYNLENSMLQPGTEILLKKGIGIHDAFSEIKNHHLFGKRTLFIMLCGIQSAFCINFRNQVRILGENPEDISRQLKVKAKHLQENVLKISGGLDNVICTGIIPVDYQSMSRMDKRYLLNACLKYNEWANSRAKELKCSHWETVVKYWFMLSNDAHNDLKLVLKEDIIVQDELSFTQQAKMYRKNAIMEAVTKTWELLKTQDLRIMLNKNIENCPEKEALKKPHIKKPAPITKVSVKVPTSLPQNCTKNNENDMPVVNNDNRVRTADASDSEISISSKEMGNQQEKIRHFQSIILVGTPKLSNVLKKHVKDNIKFIVAKQTFDEKSDEFILCQQKQFQGATLWVCLVDCLRLTFTANASLCEKERYCNQPQRISKLKDNENEVVKAEQFISRMIPKLNKGSAIILAPLVPSQVVLESFFKNHAHIHSFSNKSEIPIFTGGKESLIRNINEYEKNWLTMIHNDCCRQKIVEGYENALEEYVKYKGPLLDFVESQHLPNNALVEWQEFMEALFMYFKLLEAGEYTSSICEDILDQSGMVESNLSSSIHETISESDLHKKSNIENITETSSEIKSVNKDKIYIPSSNKERKITEKEVNPKKSETSESKIGKQNKEIEKSKISDIRNDDKCVENSSIKKTNDSILIKSTDMKRAEEGLGKDSKVLTKVVSQDPNILSRLEESVVSKKTLTDVTDTNSMNLKSSSRKTGTQLDGDAKTKVNKGDEENCKKSININDSSICKKLNTVSDLAEGIESISNNNESQMQQSIHDVKIKGKINAGKTVSQVANSISEVQVTSRKTQSLANKSDTLKNLLKTVEPSDDHKKSPTTLCEQNMGKENNKIHELADKSQPVIVNSQDSSIVKTVNACTKNVLLSEIPENLNDEVIEELLKTCGPIISFKRNNVKGPAEAVCGDNSTAARVARLFNRRMLKNKSVYAWLPKDGSLVKESIPKLVDIEESLEDKEAIKKIEEILNKHDSFSPLKFKPRSLSLSDSTSTATEKNNSNSSDLVIATHEPICKDSIFSDVEIKCYRERTERTSSLTNVSNEDIRNSGIKKTSKSIDKKDVSAKSSENKNKDTSLINKEDHNICNITGGESSGNGTTFENRTDIRNKGNESIIFKMNKEVKGNETIRLNVSSSHHHVEKNVGKRKRNSSKNQEDNSCMNQQPTAESLAEKERSYIHESDVSYNRNKEINSKALKTDVSSNIDFEKNSSHVNQIVEKRKRNYCDNQENNSCLNQQMEESSAEKKRSSSHESDVKDNKRLNRKGSQGNKEKELLSRSNSCKPESTTSISHSTLFTKSNFSAPDSSTALSSITPESPLDLRSSGTPPCEANIENDPILNGLPDGFRSQLGDVQWNEFVNRLTIKYKHHRAEYDEYHQDPELHDEYEKKRDSFLQMLEMQKPNVQQNEKDILWNQFWRDELNKYDEEKWKQRKNSIIKVTLKKSKKNVDSNLVEKNPSSFKNSASQAIHKNHLEEKNHIKKEPVDLVDTNRIRLKEEKMDPLGSMKVESDIKIESNKELATYIKKEPSLDFDMSISLNFGSDDQLDPEAFVKDLDKLCTDYIPVGDVLDISGPSTSSERVRSPEFNFEDPQEFYLKRERSVNEDYSAIETRLRDSQEDPFNGTNEQCITRSEGFPHQQHDYATIGSIASDISQKEKQNDTLQSNFKVKDALNTIQKLSNRLSLLGPPLSNCIDKIKNESADSLKGLKLLQDKNFLCLLAAAADAFEMEIARINDTIQKSLLEVARKYALDLIEYARSKPSACIHGVNIEHIAQRTLYKPSKECRQFIEDAIMYETNSCVKPPEDIVKEIFSKVSMLHYDMIRDGMANTGNIE